MSKKEKATLLPRLRFNEFSSTGDWNQFTLEKVADRITEKVGDKQLTTLSISAGVGFVSQAEKFSRDISGKQYANYICLRKGDFSYNKGNSKKFPQGCIYELVEYEEAAVPSAFISFHFKESYVPNFYKGYFDNNFHGKQLTRFITSGARMDGLLNIRPSDFFSIVLPTPKEKEEQQKIADCLSSLDGLITAEDKKLSALKDHKKGLMQKLFPAEGKTVPEWRFPEFRDSGDWTRKKLGQFADVLMCKRIFANDTNEKTGIPFYKIGTLGGKPDAFISKELFCEYRTKYNYPKRGEILLTCSGTVGKCLVYDGGEAYYQDSNIVWIDNPSLEVSNELLLNLLLNTDWTKLNSTTITRIYGSDLRNLSLAYPKDSKEQQKIADCFYSVEQLIAAQFQKNEALKKHKIGLMQGLFPSIEEVEV